MNPQSEFLRIITERGYMHQATNFEGLDEAATEKCLPLYIFNFRFVSNFLVLKILGLSKAKHILRLKP